MTDHTVPSRRRLGAPAMMTVAFLALAACGGGNAEGGNPEGGKAAAESPARASARPEESTEPATPGEVFEVSRIVNGLGPSLRCTQVAWDDATCGKDLTAAGKTARVVSEHIDEKLPGRYAEEKKAADDMVDMVDTIKKLGCFEMGGTLPEGSGRDTRSLCTTLATTASLSWLYLAGTPG